MDARRTTAALTALASILSLTTACPPSAPTEGSPPRGVAEGNDPADAALDDGIDAAAPASDLWSTIPASNDAGVPSVVRISLTPAEPFEASAATADHVVVLEGTVSDDDLAAFASDPPPRSLLDRAAPASLWTDGSDPATTLYVQATRPLLAGSATVLVHFPRRPIDRVDLTIAPTTPILRRIWPPIATNAAPSEAWIYCGDPSLDLTTATGSLTLAPAGASMTAQPLQGVPCVSLTPDAPLVAAGYIVPPTVGDDGVALDPAPLEVAADVAAVPSTACLAREVAFGSLCLRVDDDRLIVEQHGGNGAAVVGTWSNVGGSAPWISVVSDGHPAVLRGLPPLKYVHLSGQIRRPGVVDDPIESGVLTFAAHAHVVVNEAQRRPPSKLVTQRFVELVNDGTTAASLGGLSLQDGTVSYALGDVTIAPGAFMLVVPVGFVSGLQGDATIADGTPLIFVPALDLTTGVALVDATGSLISRLPALVERASRHASEGRCAPWWPDDATAGIGFDSDASATPGAPNAVVGCQ